MKTPVCPTCGCSLVRLGISKDNSIRHRHNGDEYLFCCQGCVDLFIADPQKHLQETSNLVVCPTCLGERPPQRAVELKVAGQELHFCRCPSCAEVFRKNPDYYIRRLEGSIPSGGVPDHEGHSVRPD